MDYSGMDHGHMDHGDMDMGGDQCSMNVRTKLHRSGIDEAMIDMFRCFSHGPRRICASYSHNGASRAPSH